MSTRVKNSADLEAYSRVVKKCLLAWDYKYLKPDREEVAVAYHDFCLELLRQTVRPSKELLPKAVKKEHKEVSHDDADCFVDRMMSVFKNLRLKGRTATSLKKINVKMRDLVAVAKKEVSSRVSPSPSPVHHKGGSSGSNQPSSENSRAKIFEKYGLPAHMAGTQKMVLEVSSDEDAAYAKASKPSAAEPSIDCEWLAMSLFSKGSMQMELV